MAAKFAKEEIMDSLESLTSNPPTLSIVVKEEYTPTEYLRQRYVVKLMSGARGSGSVIAAVPDLLDPRSQIQEWMRILKIPKSRVFLKW